MSQAGLQPIRAGRFYVHTPTHRARPRARSISRSTPASPSAPASMRPPPAASQRSTGSSATGAAFANIADIGTGTGLLAFAALALWPEAQVHRDRHRPGRDRRRARQCGDQRREARPRRGRAAAGGRRRHGFAAARRPRAVRPDHRQHPRRAADRAGAGLCRRRWRRAGRSSSPACSTPRPTASLRLMRRSASAWRDRGSANGRYWCISTASGSFRPKTAIATQLDALVLIRQR